MTFDEVAGQKAIVRTLKNAIEGNKLAHAYLFCGPRGTGKTSMARLIAKALNCEEGIGHQCNHCSNCLALNSGSHPDVVEIDAASNNGVDQVRELVDNVRYSPIKGRMKIYIIDEVHMMSQGAFNALLKTLEEPPSHVIFILATTEPHKVLPTILSRCQRYDFGKIEDADLKEKLRWVLEQESVQYEEGGIDEIVALADGGMRDSLSILDQALAYGGNVLRQADVLSVFGLTSSKQRVALLKLLASGDISGVLKIEQEFLDGGIDIKRLCLSLLDVLKDLLIYRRTKTPSLLTTLKEEEAKELSRSIDSKLANQMIDILLKTQMDFKTVSNIRSLFELALLQLASLSGNAPEEEEEVAPTPVPEKKPAEIPESTAKPVYFEPEPEPAPAPKPVKIKPESAPEPEFNQPYSGTVAPAFLFDEEQPQSEEELAMEVQPEPVIEVPPTHEPEPVQELESAPVQKPEPEPAPLPKPEPKPEPRPEVYKPALDVSDLGKVSVVSDGTLCTIDDQTIVSIMVLGAKFKSERQTLHGKWEAFQQLRLDANVGEVATLLAEGKPFCLCEEALLVNYNFTKKRDMANYEENQAIIAKMVGKILGRHVFVYALDRQDSNRCQNLYFSLKQVGKLPDLSNINLKLPKGE